MNEINKSIIKYTLPESFYKNTDSLISVYLNRASESILRRIMGGNDAIHKIKNDE